MINIAKVILIIIRPILYFIVATIIVSTFYGFYELVGLIIYLSNGLYLDINPQIENCYYMTGKPESDPGIKPESSISGTQPATDAGKTSQPGSSTQGSQVQGSSKAQPPSSAATGSDDTVTKLREKYPHLDELGIDPKQIDPNFVPMPRREFIRNFVAVWRPGPIINYEEPKRWEPELRGAWWLPQPEWKPDRRPFTGLVPLEEGASTPTQKDVQMTDVDTSNVSTPRQSDIPMTDVSTVSNAGKSGLDITVTESRVSQQDAPDKDSHLSDKAKGKRRMEDPISNQEANKVAKQPRWEPKWKAYTFAPRPPTVFDQPWFWQITDPTGKSGKTIWNHGLNSGLSYSEPPYERTIGFADDKDAWERVFKPKWTPAVKAKPGYDPQSPWLPIRPLPFPVDFEGQPEDFSKYTEKEFSEARKYVDGNNMSKGMLADMIETKRVRDNKKLMLDRLGPLLTKYDNHCKTLAELKRTGKEISFLQEQVVKSDKLIEAYEARARQRVTKVDTMYWNNLQYPKDWDK